MSYSANRYNRKANRPERIDRTRDRKADRPTDRKARNRAARERALAFGGRA